MATKPGHAAKVDMQNRLFAELSRMFGVEVPLYDKSLLVNRVCNRAVCDLLAVMHPGFVVSDVQLEKTSGERHGAIRIGRADEYRWVGRFFACFGMEPHNFYDMTSVGAKSQPVIATAFRSLVHPEHRVFTSLLRTDYFDQETRERIETLLATRSIFSDRARALIERSEREGGLGAEDADALIAEGVERIFKWTGQARDYALYKDLCNAGFKIAADIACFQAHHLNHLTPNTFCMDLYTAAMKHCLGEMGRAEFEGRALDALRHVVRTGGRDFLRLCFKHLSRKEIESFGAEEPGSDVIDGLVRGLSTRLGEPDLRLSTLNHSGFKDSTEGPPSDTPVLLRQDAYKALTEPVHFTNPDGTEIDAGHTARFGEIEQRFYATTPEGRTLYDSCLAAAEADKKPGSASGHFAPFPKTLGELVESGLVYARYEVTEKGRAARGTVATANIHELVRSGLVACDGLRYEDFLPVSAAGIFASNLNQYGTRSTASERPTYTRQMLEEILGKPIVDADAVYRGLWADSLLGVYSELGVLDRLSSADRAALERDASACPPEARMRFDEQSVLAARV